MEIPSMDAALAKSAETMLSDKVSEGTKVLDLEAAGEGASAPAPAAAAPAPAPAEAPAAQAPAPAPAPAATAPAASGGSVDIVVPDIGDFDEVAVIEVLVKVGDAV